MCVKCADAGAERSRARRVAGSELARDERDVVAPRQQRRAVDVRHQQRLGHCFCLGQTRVSCTRRANSVGGSQVNAQALSHAPISLLGNAAIVVSIMSSLLPA